MENINNLTSVKVDKKLLDKEYNKSMNDEFFSKIVSKLKLDKEYLENYTSFLEESSLEFRNCSNCVISNIVKFLFCFAVWCFCI